MKKQHTPGPWFLIDDEEFGAPCKAITGRGWDIATLWGGYNAADADALLMIAAPDLLSALSAIIEAGDVRNGSREHRDAVAAIAKAEGAP
jgi:hypothetical protein